MEMTWSENKNSVSERQMQMRTVFFPPLNQHTKQDTFMKGKVIVRVIAEWERRIYEDTKSYMLLVLTLSFSNRVPSEMPRTFYQGQRFGTGCPMDVCVLLQWHWLSVLTEPLWSKDETFYTRFTKTERDNEGMLTYFDLICWNVRGFCIVRSSLGLGQMCERYNSSYRRMRYVSVFILNMHAELRQYHRRWFYYNSV